MRPLHFDNRFLRELPGDASRDTGPRVVEHAMYSRVDPARMPAPELLAWSPEAAARIDLDATDIDAGFVGLFSGQHRVEGAAPFASNYGGHQFGHWAGQLGDGRAISLGETLNAQGERWELQLKGAGRTPYSRGADGRAVLRSSLREFLCSEAMHHLGVPTTRALCLIGTGERVVRDMFYDGHPQHEPGAIVCRMAPSFIRFGHFELPASRGDLALLEQLVEFTIERDFPELPGSGKARRADWFADICARTARMIAEWMRVGFVHGVMNTDNMSVLGLTIDYGPYGWIEPYDPDWTPNTTDAQRRRYRFGRQPDVAYWNLGCLASALAPVVDDDEALRRGLQHYVDTLTRHSRHHHARKLGLEHFGDDDLPLLQDLHTLMARAQMDMTLTFRGLCDVDPQAPSCEPLEAAFYDAALRASHDEAMQSWLARYAARLRADAWDDATRREHMLAANPCYVPRNYLAQQAIERAEQGDMQALEDWLDVLRHPYTEQAGAEVYAARRPAWAAQRAGCSMLSCSS
ncbi:protein adenylyltransferase SelO [Oleiagrimonas soli]|uniref:Protein nucleotidyltransferase YdiU n=1 Tax=Oleiagrimonas soli TaxID=1543381 RepID=A0A099CX11_9GAMM|nr:YdiU family protein [Oleiagrimonas soli]KGI78226.1 hypothetical protein LF63_0107795 [Oleiagrimonas soli]MBB6183311.1 uncharacterized protein YdiU (UPF0061 family) [Oleiagrimonas soli]